MPTLLVVHHTPSPPTHQLLLAALAGTRREGLAEVEVVQRPALTVGEADVLRADGYLLGTPVNFGYMSGALKHAFDTCYYACVESTRRRPWGLWVHGNNDTASAVTSVQRIVAGLEWAQVAPVVEVTGAPSAADLDAVEELAATVAAQLLV